MYLLNLLCEQQLQLWATASAPSSVSSSWVAVSSERKQHRTKKVCSGASNPTKNLSTTWNPKWAMQAGFQVCQRWVSQPMVFSSQSFQQLHTYSVHLVLLMSTVGRIPCCLFSPISSFWMACKTLTTCVQLLTHLCSKPELEAHETCCCPQHHHISIWLLHDIFLKLEHPSLRQCRTMKIGVVCKSFDVTTCTNHFELWMKLIFFSKSKHVSLAARRRE